MWFVFIQQAQARRWWMGSLKFTIGLSLLSYESRQPEAFADLSSFPLAFRFWSWDVLPDIPPYLILSFHHFIYLSAFDLMIKPFRFFPPAFTFCSRLGFCCSWILIKLGFCGIWTRKRSFDLAAPFRFLLKVAFLELPLVPYLWRFSFCAYTIPRRLPGVYSQNRQSCIELFVHVQGWIFHWHIWYN